MTTYAPIAKPVRTPVVTELPTHVKVEPAGAVTFIEPVLPPKLLALFTATVIGIIAFTVAVADTLVVPQALVARITYKPLMAVVAEGREILVPVDVKAFAAAQVVVAAMEEVIVTAPTKLEPAHTVGIDAPVSVGLLLITVVNVFTVVQPFAPVIRTLYMPAVLKARLLAEVLTVPPLQV